MFRQSHDVGDNEQNELREWLESVAVSPDLPNHLMRHQKFGIAIADRYPKYGLFFETGTGKTVTAIEIIARKKVKTLVVMPLSIIESVWIKDIKRFKPDMTFCNLYPLSKQTRVEQLNLEYDVFLINYDGFRVSYDDIRTAGFRMLVVDESSKMKNPRSRISVLLNSFAKKMDYVYLLSGTPAPNSPLEYYMQIDALSPGLLGRNFWAYREKYFYQPYINKPWKWVIIREKKQELLNLIKSVSVSVRKEDIVDLPERVFEKRVVEMTPLQVDAYNNYLQMLFNAVKDGTDRTKGELFKSIMKLREITSGFYYEDSEEGDRDNGNRVIIRLSDTKFRELDSVLEEIGDQQVIIWANFKFEIEEIENRLLRSDRTVTTLYSGTRDRERAINDFKMGMVQYLVAHPQTAGHGLTFTNCSYALYFSLNYSLELWQQSLDRIYRYGQKNKCTYIILTARDSIDEIIYNKLLKKQEISSDILNNLNLLVHRGRCSFKEKKWIESINNNTNLSLLRQV